MKLRRSWPAIFIWFVFVLFDIVMVASCSYFSGLFPSDNLLVYSCVFTALSILAMSVLTFALGRLSDHLMVHDFVDKAAFKVFYALAAVLIIVGGGYYRLELLAHSAGEIVGKYSLYENAMVGGKNLTPEYDLLSIVYSGILKFILIFTGNIISVAFFFQIACFTIFMICGFFTVKMLLGRTAALVFTAYVAFVPIFTTAFTGLELSTDYLFMAMFGIELLFVALFLKGAYLSKFRSGAWVILFLIVGIVVGFMAYVDAGTIIMILPFLVAPIFFYGKWPTDDLMELFIIILGALLAFFGMIAQEAGFAVVSDRLANWASYYFHNLNIVSMFWTYTDHKLLYLITVVAMSGVLVGFWKNRKVEKISPWLLSMLFMFATVPFMGATRMNTQAFVTVYYALILGCVASLITLPAYETGDVDTEVKELSDEANAAAEETADEPKAEGISAVVEPETEAAKTSGVASSEAEFEGEEAAESVDAEITTNHAESETESVQTDDKPEKAPRYVPEGMVLPEDDEDVDLTPHMKMPEFKGSLGPDGKPEKIKLNRPETAAILGGAAVAAAEAAKIAEDIEPAEPESPEEIVPAEPETVEDLTSADEGQEYSITKDDSPKAPQEHRFVDRKDDFDIALKPGDDFDI
ncbi:hypothetical protein [Butyrivibrio sp. AE2032]|uniref:hypothetical protein n=1 Tax=Butyrivibrio sp. AE2032 TaxID=1458463 RepID=UPI00054F30EC|nr:hypothetical protein [Butyrivibrio sp. AE2032]